MSKPLSKKKEISSHQIFDLPCTKEWELKHGICSSNRQILISLILSFNCFSTSWHALLVWFSVFILSADPSPCSTCDSVWRSLYFSRPVFFCAPCSSTILSGRQKKNKIPHTEAEWDISTHTLKENEHQAVVCVSLLFICVILRGAGCLRYGLSLQTW